MANTTTKKSELIQRHTTNEALTHNKALHELKAKQIAHENNQRENARLRAESVAREKTEAKTLVKEQANTQNVHKQEQNAVLIAQNKLIEQQRMQQDAALQQTQAEQIKNQTQQVQQTQQAQQAQQGQQAQANTEKNLQNTLKPKANPSEQKAEEKSKEAMDRENNAEKEASKLKESDKNLNESDKKLKPRDSSDRLVDDARSKNDKNLQLKPQPQQTKNHAPTPNLNDSNAHTKAKSKEQEDKEALAHKSKNDPKENLDSTKKNDPSKIAKDDGKRKDEQLKAFSTKEFAASLRAKAIKVHGVTGCGVCDEQLLTTCKCGKSKKGGGLGGDDTPKNGDSTVEKSKPISENDNEHRAFVPNAKWNTPQFQPKHTVLSEQEKLQVLTLLKDTFHAFMRDLRVRGLHTTDAEGSAFSYDTKFNDKGQLIVAIYLPFDNDRNRFSRMLHKEIAEEFGDDLATEVTNNMLFSRTPSLTYKPAKEKSNEDDLVEQENLSSEKASKFSTPFDMKMTLTME